MKKTHIIFIAILAFSLHSCRKDYLYVPPPITTNLSFARDIYPILDNSTYNCKNCHSPSTNGNTPDLSTATIAFDSLQGNSMGGAKFINTATPPSSVFYQSVNDPNFSYGQMPPGNPMSSADQAKILTWITQGAKP